MEGNNYPRLPEQASQRLVYMAQLSTHRARPVNCVIPKPAPLASTGPRFCLHPATVLASLGNGSGARPGSLFPLLTFLRRAIRFAERFIRRRRRPSDHDQKHIQHKKRDRDVIEQDRLR